MGAVLKTVLATDDDPLVEVLLEGIRKGVEGLHDEALEDDPVVLEETESLLS
jgi:hypothetical protein